MALTKVQVADALFHLVHVTHDHLQQMVWQDELLAISLAGSGVSTTAFAVKGIEVVFLQAVLQDLTIGPR
jgi:hypothetical protein